MIYTPSRLTTRTLTQETRKKTTDIYFLHAHGIQQVSEKLVCILLLVADILIVFPTDRHLNISDVTVKSQSMDEGNTNGVDVLGTHVLPALGGLYPPCLLHHEKEDVTERHTLDPRLLILGPKTMTICEQRRPSQQNRWSCGFPPIA